MIKLKNSIESFNSRLIQAKESVNLWRQYIWNSPFRGEKKREREREKNEKEWKKGLRALLDTIKCNNPFIAGIQKEERKKKAEGLFKEIMADMTQQSLCWAYTARKPELK